MPEIAERAKYVVTKRRNTDNRATYQVFLQTDAELVEHVRGTVNNTEHEILSVLNLKPTTPAQD